jgi:hypothetical protein
LKESLWSTSFFNIAFNENRRSSENVCCKISFHSTMKSVIEES